MTTEKQYILGTDPEELERLGFQHRVWSKEMFELWESSGVSQGSRVLDLGCGPGFCSFDLAQIVGHSGNITGIDISNNFIQYADEQARTRNLTQAHFQCSSFDELNLEPNSFDFIYSRWALAWIDNPEDVLKKVYSYLKPGGVFMAQEYMNWGNFRVEPETPEVRKVIEACRESWRIMPGTIDIGPHLASWLSHLGADVFLIKPLIKITRPNEMTWHWPGSFLKIYSSKLIAMGLLSQKDRNAFIQKWSELESLKDTVLYSPMMMSLAARKVG